MNYIVNHRKTQFSSTTYVPDMELISSKTFKEFDDTFNMFLDIRNKDFDWFNNQYLQINVYQMQNEYKPMLVENIEMHKCSKEELLEFI